MKIIKTIKSILRAITVLSAIFCCPEYCCSGAVEVQVKDWCGLEQELPVITKAAERNGVQGEDFLILLAIRKAENGSPGKEFGVMHPICQALINIQPQNSLDIQAGWAAATIVKNRSRWESAGRSGAFIDFLADRYCPAATDAEGNPSTSLRMVNLSNHKNWKINVRYWYGRFSNQRRSC